MNTDGAATLTSAAAVVALRAGAPAKSRLASVGEALRRELAWAMAVDTLTALRQAVQDVWVVGTVAAGEFTRLGLDVTVLADPEVPGLNAALRHGARALRTRGADPVVACVGDLPALKPSSVTAVLAVAAGHERTFVPDRCGEGTTMLIASGVDLDPRFGGGSAAAHEASGAHPVRTAELAVPDARADVDTENDLAVAQRLGLGRATTEVLVRAGKLRPLP